MVRAKMLKRQRATVFTVGMPYTFVDGWRDKTVGHVMSRTLPHRSAPRDGRRPAPQPPAAFTAVFDAGILRQSESPEVRRRLRHGRTYPLVLRDLAANSAALQTYTALLPVEGIFLDTLGDEGSIMFADARRGMKPMSAAEIGLTLDLAHAPLVFSHIAFSWLSVGAAFMSAGARGYVGTLWSVESEPAQEMALRELGTTEQSGEVDDMTRRAYVHLGLVGPVASTEADASPAAAAAPGGILPNEAARESLLSAMLYLAEAGLHEQAEPLFRHWEALCQEDLAAAGDEAGFLKEDMDAEEREYHKREQAGRERRAAGATQDLAGEPGRGRRSGQPGARAGDRRHPGPGRPLGPRMAACRLPSTKPREISAVPVALLIYRRTQTTGRGGVSPHAAMPGTETQSRQDARARSPLCLCAFASWRPCVWGLDEPAPAARLTYSQTDGKMSLIVRTSSALTTHDKTRGVLAHDLAHDQGRSPGQLRRLSLGSNARRCLHRTFVIHRR